MCEVFARVSSYINGRAPLLRNRLMAQSPRNRARQDAFFSSFVSLAFEDMAAEVAAHIKAQLFTAGTPIGPYDMQIAAIALANNLILVTHNTREFARVPSLQIENWEV